MTWLEQQVRQSKLLEIVLAIVAIAAVGGAIAFNQRYLENVYAGPYAMPAAELTAAKSAEDLPRYWVRFAPERVLDTGIDHVTVNKRRGIETGRSITGHFWAGLVGDRMLFIEAKGKMLAQGETLTGKLVDTPQTVGDHLLKGVNPTWKPRVLPIMLELGDFENLAYIGLSLGAVIVAGALVWTAIAARRAMAPRQHRALQALEAASIPLGDASASIEHDIRTGSSLGLGSHRITREYLLKSGLGFDVRCLRDLLWAYPIEVSHKLYGIIPTGKSHKLALYFPDKALTMKISKPAADRIVSTLAKVAPWTFLGHSPELEQAWKKQRERIVAAVAERRAQVSAHLPSAPPAAEQASVEG